MTSIKKRFLIQNEEEKSANPDFWNNPKEAELVMKNLRGLKKWVNDYEKIVGLKDDLSVVLDYFREGEATEEEVKQLESELGAMSRSHLNSETCSLTKEMI